MSAKQSSLGRSIIKNHSKKKKIVIKDGQRHTSNLPDGRDWGRLNLHSVTQLTSLDEFLDKVKLANDEYIEECHNIKIVAEDVAFGMLSEKEKAMVADAQEKHKVLLSIPRRPHWDATTSKEELDKKENEGFLEWRRNLALLSEEEHINLTPYERNLEIWRQLWRVIERSDVIVQIIDSRNPLLFRCEDLEIYVKETNVKKLNVLLLNKADFLTLQQRLQWAQYFSNIGVKVVFFSALQQMEKAKEDVSDKDESSDDSEDNSSGEEDECDNVSQPEETKQKYVQEVEKEKQPSSENSELVQEISESDVYNDHNLLSREELILFLKTLGQKVSDSSTTTIGLVGYPNVGKSSTINAVLMSKKVSVSATPGKTKHFQTLMIEPDLCFCDCPGLVFPNFVSTKAEMVVNGILPIDQLTSPLPPVTLVASMIPRRVLQSTYSIMIQTPSKDEEDAGRPPTAEELLNAHGYMRGFMTARGLPDVARSARYILKDFVNGKLLYCHAPPGMKQEEYHEYFISTEKSKISGQTLIQALKATGAGDRVDKDFFKKNNCGVHIKGINVGSNLQTCDKNSKEFKHHNNRNRRQKLRKVYTHVNQ